MPKVIKSASSEQSLINLKNWEEGILFIVPSGCDDRGFVIYRRGKTTLVKLNEDIKKRDGFFGDFICEFTEGLKLLAKSTNWRISSKVGVTCLCSWRLVV